MKIELQMIGVKMPATGRKTWPWTKLRTSSQLNVSGRRSPMIWNETKAQTEIEKILMGDRSQAHKCWYPSTKRPNVKWDKSKDQLKQYTV